VAGTSKLSQASQGQVRQVDEVVVYPSYTDPREGKDAALLKLEEPLDLSGENVKAIPLVTPADAAAGMTAEGQKSWVSGWGTLTAGGNIPDALQAVEVPIISNEKADELYDDVAITEDQLAAGILIEGGKDSCQGDSGGPLVVKDAQGVFKLAGIVSWGYGCAEGDSPGMYGRVSSFEPWIKDVLAGGAEPPPPVELQNGSTEVNLSGGKGTWAMFRITVPAGATNLTIKTSGGSGDGDLYMRFDKAPTSSKWDCRPYVGGNQETCTVAAPQAGSYYAGIYAFSAYSGVSLVGSYTPPATE
jgi:hypothetical protein